MAWAHVRFIPFGVLAIEKENTTRFHSIIQINLSNLGRILDQVFIPPIHSSVELGESLYSFKP